MKILNKYPVLADIIKLGENSIQFKFKETPYFDQCKDLFVVNVFGLKMFGDDLHGWVEAVKKEHGNGPTVLTIEDDGMEIYRGNFDEDPDWGSWGGTFVPFDFETYNTEYKVKTQDDLDHQLVCNIKMKVYEKMFQSVTDPDFRESIREYCQSQLKYTMPDEPQQKRMQDILNKVSHLEATDFYNIFVHDFRFEID